jgi:hypothetical protein
LLGVYDFVRTPATVTTEPSSSGEESVTSAADLRRNSEGTSQRVADGWGYPQAPVVLWPFGVRAQGREFRLEVLVAAVDQADAVDHGGTLSRQGRDEVAEPGP